QYCQPTRFTCSPLRAPQPTTTPFPYTTLFRSPKRRARKSCCRRSAIFWRRSRRKIHRAEPQGGHKLCRRRVSDGAKRARRVWFRSEEHTSELQSRRDLVCRLLLEKKTPSYTLL